MSLAQAQTVEFERDVAPILKTRCLRCHGVDQASGGLRLDERQFAERGGGSGKNLLTAENSNELLRRVRSTVEGERMPLEGDFLSPEQIDTLTRWLDQGAHWPPPKVPTTRSPHLLADERGWFERLLDGWEYLARPRFRLAHWSLIAVLVAMLLIEHSKGLVNKTAREADAAAPRPAVAQQLARISRAWYLVGMLAGVLYLTVLIAREEMSDLQDRLDRQTAVLSQAGHAPGPSSSAHLHDPLRPHHPPRMGGIYYRGNDERVDGLFNGGFYRTATFNVHLADAEGHRIGWDDPIPDPPFIRLEIVRSPHSQPSLFNEDTMSRVGLSSTQPEQVATAEEIPFLKLHTEEKGDRWTVLYPLAEIPAQGKLTGKLYLYRGSSDQGFPLVSEPSYLIGYELSATDGLVSRESQIWMASVYNVTTIQWPEKGKIQADHWFDFRPIPEIEK